MRAQEQGRLSQLEALANKQNLTNSEMATATGIIQSLTDTYGDLGVKLNEVTGQLEGFAKAKEEVNKLLAEAKKAELQAAMLEEQRNIKELMDAMVSDARMQWAFVEMDEEEDLASQQGEIDSRLRNLSALGKAWKAAAAEVAFYNREVSGDTALAGDDTAPATGPDPMSDDAGAMNKRMLDEIADYRTQQIQDEDRQAIAAINKRYDAEMEKARELGAELILVKGARRAALEGVASDRRAALERVASDTARQKREQAEWDAGLRKDATRRLRDQTDRLKIEMSTTDEKERQRKVIEQERRIALRDAGDTGPDRAAIQEHYDMRLSQLDQLDQPKDAAVPRGVALTATYSAAAASISGYQPGAAGPEEKMVSGISAIDKKAEEMLTKADWVTEKVEELTGVFGKFLAGWVVP